MVAALRQLMINPSKDNDWFAATDLSQAFCASDVLAIGLPFLDTRSANV